MDETEKAIYEALCQILEDVTETDARAISPRSTLGGDLEVDSVTLIELTLAIQDRFHISVRDGRIRGLSTVWDVVALIREATVSVA